MISKTSLALEQSALTRLGSSRVTLSFCFDKPKMQTHITDASFELEFAQLPQLQQSLIPPTYKTKSSLNDPWE